MQRLLVALLMVVLLALPGCTSVSTDGVELALEEEVDDITVQPDGANCVLAPTIT